MNCTDDLRVLNLNFHESLVVSIHRNPHKLLAEVRMCALVLFSTYAFGVQELHIIAPLYKDLVVVPDTPMISVLYLHPLISDHPIRLSAFKYRERPAIHASVVTGEIISSHRSNKRVSLSVRRLVGRILSAYCISITPFINCNHSIPAFSTHHAVQTHNSLHENR